MTRVSDCIPVLLSLLFLLELYCSPWLTSTSLATNGCHRVSTQS